MMTQKELEVLYDTFKETQRAAVEAAALIGGIRLVLVEKGVCTLQELEIMEARVRASLDQATAGMRGILR